jgi:uncharacterized protein (DUF2164 family)
MAIELDKEVRVQAIGSVERGYQENLDGPVGNVRAEALLNFVLAEIGPSLCNRTIADAQARRMARVGEVDIECHEDALRCWHRAGHKRKRWAATAGGTHRSQRGSRRRLCWPARHAGVPSRLRWCAGVTRALRPTLAGERLLFGANTSSPPTKRATSQRSANGASARGRPPSHYHHRSLSGPVECLGGGTGGCFGFAGA